MESSNSRRPGSLPDAASVPSQIDLDGKEDEQDQAGRQHAVKSSV
jgi:hypothetical protein